MDVAISISSALYELYQKNNQISDKVLKSSGIDIGKDIMGTMTNILFFAYVSGSMPMLILYLKNASPLGFTLSKIGRASCREIVHVMMLAFLHKKTSE